MHSAYKTQDPKEELSTSHSYLNLFIVNGTCFLEKGDAVPVTDGSKFRQRTYDVSQQALRIYFLTFRRQSPINERILIETKVSTVAIVYEAIYRFGMRMTIS